MKKSELTQLTRIIEHLVAREVRKQLPRLIAETFQKMAGTTQQPIVEQKVEEDKPLSVFDNPDEFKASLKDIFASGTPEPREVVTEAQPARRPFKQYTKNPVLNEILNATKPLRESEGAFGMAARMGGYSPNIPIAGPGQMMAPEEMPSFGRNVPSMPGNLPSNIPVGTPPVLREGQESTHAPMEAIPEGISALDVARQVPLAKPVAQALTRNYKDMMKLIDQKKGRK